MIRVGIVGSDNSHALAFSQLLNTEKGQGDPRWADARCVAIYGTDKARNEEVAEKARIPHISPTVEDMLDRVDAAMVVWRHGDLHASHALPFLRAGKPVFVDKPFAIKLEDCKAMLEAAHYFGAPITSYSTTRWTPAIQALLARKEEFGDLLMGQVSGPADLNSEYGGVFFYANHAVEMMFQLFGHGAAGIYAREGQGNVNGVVRWPDGKLVNLNLHKSARATYSATVHGAKGWVSSTIDIGGCYADGLDVFLKMVRSKVRPLTDEQLTEPTRLLHALLKSLASGREEAI
ncbi:MAG: Gfo/Idh/MocA family oxidoreductase [Armatimonadetes bacterium]|nr:Gfo/Idh/MocA family oxidoreductase [Armatimonadota bacterium]